MVLQSQWDIQTEWLTVSVSELIIVSKPCYRLLFPLHCPPGPPHRSCGARGLRGVSHHSPSYRWIWSPERFDRVPPWWHWGRLHTEGVPDSGASCPGGRVRRQDLTVLGSVELYQQSCRHCGGWWTEQRFSKTAAFVGCSQSAAVSVYK